MNIQEIASKIDVPVEKWAGNCYAIACQMAKFAPKGYRPVYGKWNGYVSPNSMFATRSIINHGWLYNEDADTVIDPTRFVFEGTEPYIHQGPNSSEYDIASQEFATIRFRMRPLPNKHAGAQNITEWSDEADQQVKSILCDESTERRDWYSSEELFYLANAPVSYFGAYASDIYSELKRLDCKAFIPIDNWELVMRI